jgi:hypothetical protein
MLLGTEATASGFLPSTRQREAIEAPLGPALVLAGPGAGKTFCLIERIRFLIEQRDFSPSHICAVTFTNKAAQEIAERLEKALGERGEGIKGGTLHALCAEILREHGEWVGARRGFGIADEEYQMDVLRRLGVWEKRRRWLLGRFGLHRVSGVELTPDDLGIFTSYRAHLEQRNLLDFDDLVDRTASLFANYDEIAEVVAGRWDYVLVDEFQDLNPLQYAIVKRLARAHGNLFVVGDDEQSVFSWTGADPRVLRQFVNDFGLSQKHIVLLDENRRNARQIFEPARRLLGQNPSCSRRRCARSGIVRVSVSVVGFARRSRRGHLAPGRPRGGPGQRRAAVGRVRGALSPARDRQHAGSGVRQRGHSVPAGLGTRAAGRIRSCATWSRRSGSSPSRATRSARKRSCGWCCPRTSGPRSSRKRSGESRSPSRGCGRWRSRLAKDDEAGKKLRRADYALLNLPALARKHVTLAGLVEDCCPNGSASTARCWRIARTSCSDPATDADTLALAVRLRGAMHGRKRVWLPRMAGLELALSGLLLRAGITSVMFLDGAAGPGPEDVTISEKDGGRYGLCLGLFKALQVCTRGAGRLRSATSWRWT